MVAMIETLRQEHRNITRLLDALQHEIDVFARAGDADYDVIRGIADYFLDYPDTCHHPKEDVIFDRLRKRRPQDSVSIDDLVGEHRQIHERARWFRDTVQALLSGSDVARDTVVDAARIFIEAQRRHLAMEEDRFFPLAESKLTEEDWSDIADEIAEERDPLFGDRVEKEFADIRERLLAWHRESEAD